MHKTNKDRKDTFARITRSMDQSLNDKQKEAVQYTEGPLLILAGAGSGKTRVLTHRIAYMINEKQVNPWNILAITFTNKAAGEMKKRVEQLEAFGTESIWVATFHSTCVRILRRFADKIGYGNDFTIYDTDDQKRMLTQIVKNLNLDTKKYKNNVLGVISKAKERMQLPEDMLKECGSDYNAQTMAKIYEAYQKKLKENNAMDFDDLLCNTVRLFQQEKEVLAYYQDRFRYIMVDEYQDTNHVQFQFVYLLAEKYKNLCVVGDEDQSIYRFRGADITNILNFETYFPQAKVIKLEQNYRSTTSILNAANKVIQNNHKSESRKKTLWSECGTGMPVSFTKYEDVYEEADEVSREIKKQVREGRKYSDFVVLYRTNAQSRAFEEVCVEKNIPYHLIGGVNFYQRQEIKDILAYLKTIASGKDELAVKRIINVPKRGIGATTIDKIEKAAMAEQIGFFEILKRTDLIPVAEKTRTKIRGFVTEIENLRKEAKEKELGELIEAILEDTGYLEELQASEDENLEQRMENLAELVSKAAEFCEKKEDASLQDFLEEVALVADIDSLDTATDRVTLMTLHASKGLEFPVVFLTGMEDGLFPSALAIYSNDLNEIEEERRLCYVGVTRAQRELFLSAVGRRMVHGETRYFPVSRFIREMQLTSYEDSDTNDFGFKPMASESSTRYTENVFDLPDFLKEQPKRSGGFFENQSSKQPTIPSFGKAFVFEKASKLSYEEGDRVRHAQFGEGIVTKITDGKRDYTVSVEFDSGETRKMLAGFANLQKI